MFFTRRDSDTPLKVLIHYSTDSLSITTNHLVFRHFISYRYIGHFISYRYIGHFISYRYIGHVISYRYIGHFISYQYIGHFISYRYIGHFISYRYIGHFISYQYIGHFISYRYIGHFISYQYIGHFISYRCIGHFSFDVTEWYCQYQLSDSDTGKYRSVSRAIMTFNTPPPPPKKKTFWRSQHTLYNYCLRMKWTSKVVDPRALVRCKTTSWKLTAWCSPHMKAITVLLYRNYSKRFLTWMICLSEDNKIISGI